MLQRSLRAGALACAVLAISGCASLTARSTFSRGVKAKDRGDLRAAIAAFEEANRQDPKLEYADALRTTRAEVARGEVAKAEAAEAAGDFAAAANHWGAALDLAPDNVGLRARKGLAEVEAKPLDPVERQRAIAALAKIAPKDRVVQARLRSSTQAAVQYHLRMARMYRDVRSWRQAFRAYESARALEPKNPIFQGALYRDVKVRELEVVGDQKLAAGDTLGAYEAYEAAVKVRPSSRLKGKMRRAQRGAGPVLEQLQRAEGLARRQEWEAAAEIYTVVAGRPGVAPEVRTQATEARAKSAAVRANRARAYAQRGLVDKAVEQLRLSLDHSDGAVSAIEAVGKAVDALDDERPGAAKAALADAAPHGAGLEVVKVANEVVLKVAARLFARAQATAQRAPADALLLLSRLEPFAKALPGYPAQKKKLVKTAFVQLLDSAALAARAGRLDAATERVASALEIAKPPEDLTAALQAGVSALKAEDWVRARADFSGAVKRFGESRLAKAGLAVAERGHLEALRGEARDAQEVGDRVRAAAAYRDILELDPADAAAQAALSDLRFELVADALQAAKGHAAGGRPGAAFVYFSRVLTLDPEHPEAKQGLAAIEAKLGGGAEPEAWVAPLARASGLGERCRGVERAARDRISVYLDRTPDLGVSVLEGEARAKVEEKKAPAPPIRVDGEVVRCAPTKTGGELAVKVRLSSGPALVFEEQIVETFDPSSVPKDELKDGLPARQVIGALMGKVASRVSQAVKAHRGDLGGWRVHLAEDRMKAGDAEGAALAYATLVKDKSHLSPEERGALDALERYLNNRFR